jgi:hypothetical protein
MMDDEGPPAVTGGLPKAPPEGPVEIRRETGPDPAGHALSFPVRRVPGAGRLDLAGDDDRHWSDRGL